MNFDRIAPFYRLLESITAGGKLQKCRISFLDEILRPKEVLILGDGNGRCLVELVRRFPQANFVSIDSSERMLQLAKARLNHGADGPTSVQFLHSDALSCQYPGRKFDLIVTHFFLDCFRREELESLIPKLADAAAPGANWLISDFRLAPKGLAKWRSKFILKLLYLFFRFTTDLSASQLTPPDTILKKSGYSLKERRVFNVGLLYSDWWIATDQ